METRIPQGRISPRDLLLRESALSDYLATWVAQSALSLNVMRLSYPTSFLPLSTWATALASLEHQMAARSQLLYSMALRVGSSMLDQRMSYSSATEICSQLFEVKGDD